MEVVIIMFLNDSIVILHRKNNNNILIHTLSGEPVTSSVPEGLTAIAYIEDLEDVICDVPRKNKMK